MANGEKKKRIRINPFDVVIVLLILCLLATFGYRIYNGVEEKSDSKTSNYVLTFACDQSVSSLADYLKKGTPVYLSANNEVLGYIYDGKNSVTVNVITEETSSDNIENTDDVQDMGEKSPYERAEIHGKIHLSEDVQVYKNGVYYTIKNVNFSVGSKLTVFTEEASFTLTVQSVSRVDK